MMTQTNCSDGNSICATLVPAAGAEAVVLIPAVNQQDDGGGEVPESSLPNSQVENGGGEVNISNPFFPLFYLFWDFI